MSIRIGGTGTTLGVLRSLRSSSENVDRSRLRLASGLRINRAADDPAGLAISERFRADIASLSQASNNANDGVSLAQTAQGGLSEIANLLSEARALAVQSSSGTLGGQTRSQVDSQFQAILSDIDAIASNTGFNSFNPLADDTLQVDVQVGATQGDTITVSGVDATAAGIGVDSLDVTTSGNAAAALSTLDTAISEVSTLAGSFGLAENRLAARTRLLSTQIEATSAAESRIRDVDYAAESARLTKNQILQEAGISVLAQANTSASIVLRLLG
ncbi:MAG: flagellin [Myxococcota bacterium]